MKYYVVTRFYDSGKVEADIVLESEFNPEKHGKKQTSLFDQYLDVFNSYESAEDFARKSKVC